MNLFTEDTLEQAALSWFESLGYSVVFGPDIACDGDSPERNNYGEVILEGRLRDALSRINKKVPSSAIDDALRKIFITESPSLIINNRNFQKMITDGIDVQFNRPDGSVKTEKIYLFDFDNADNNDWAVVNQFTVIENGINRRPDIMIFLNGIPLVIFELKSASHEETDIQKAFHQIETYIKDISSIFTYNSFCVISDGLLAKAGTMTSNFERFMSWRTEDGDKILKITEPQLETMIKGMFEKKRFLDIIKNFILFQDDGSSISKIIAGYHQYHAVNRAVENTHTALGLKSDRRIGIVWHTQGSGKSLTMVFYAAKAVQAFGNPTIIVLTDRNDLDEQLFGTFTKSEAILRQTPRQATSRAKLRELLSVESGGIIFTTIQKFSPFEEEDSFPVLTERKNVIVIADEAHRSQYGFQAEVSSKNDDTTTDVKYGYAKHMRDALPNASFIGFTGTPVDLEDRSTPAVFGDYIDIYDMTRSVEDKSTVRIFYESRIIKLAIESGASDFLDDEFDDITEYQEESYKDRLKSKWARMEAIVDYLGIAEFLKKALSQYTETDRDTAGIDINQVLLIFKEKYEVVRGILHKLDYSLFIKGTPAERMKTILSGMNFVMGLGSVREKDYLKTVMELEKAQSLCATTDEAKKLSLEIGYFKAIKANIMKIRQENIFRKTGKTKEDIEAAVNQLVSKSIISEEVIDVFEALKMDKPEMSILYDDFIDEMRNIQYKNLAAELLKRLIEGKIKLMARKQLVESKKFSEMLEKALNRYTNQAITNIEIIEELIKMAKDMEASMKRGEDLGLSEDELAFYDALCVNDAAVKIMGDDILKKIAHDLSESIRKNITIDWKLKESVRARMRTEIKKLLRKYGYPPDQQDSAVKTVMEQAELLCENESYSIEESFGLGMVAE